MLSLVALHAVLGVELVTKLLCYCVAKLKSDVFFTNRCTRLVVKLQECGDS